MSVQSVEDRKDIVFVTSEEYVRRRRREAHALSSQMNHHIQAILDRREDVFKAVEHAEQVEEKYKRFVERSN
ncbi:hypothetical protein [Paenibacillus sp. GXUN7292]|uniref:hypothetical protein n=1 Tax=Paenibacillus sp. GXUN7292 TaxID=3422499 RepID=UPI003D7C76B8